MLRYWALRSRKGITMVAPDCPCFTGWVVLSQEPASAHDLYLGDRYDKPAAPLAHIREVLHDLVTQIPWQDEDIVRTRVANGLWGQNRNMRARGVLALLVGIAVDRKIEEIRADAAIVEQCVSFA